MELSEGREFQFVLPWGLFFLEFIDLLLFVCLIPEEDTLFWDRSALLLHNEGLEELEMGIDVCALVNFSFFDARLLCSRTVGEKIAFRLGSWMSADLFLFRSRVSS